MFFTPTQFQTWINPCEDANLAAGNSTARWKRAAPQSGCCLRMKAGRNSVSLLPPRAYWSNDSSFAFGWRTALVGSKQAGLAPFRRHMHRRKHSLHPFCSQGTTAIRRYLVPKTWKSRSVQVDRSRRITKELLDLVDQINLQFAKTEPQTLKKKKVFFHFFQVAAAHLNRRWFNFSSPKFSPPFTEKSHIS